MPTNGRTIPKSASAIATTPPAKMSYFRFGMAPTGSPATLFPPCAVPVRMLPCTRARTGPTRPLQLPKEGKSWIIIAHEPGLILAPQVRAHAHAQGRAGELIVNPVTLYVKARVFRASRPTKHIRAAGVCRIRAVINEVAVEDLLM